ncbi:MAG: FecR domain-containing protein, partial [Fuerstiella sp.]|nr:FecR domain-containing protein [Fuerstiella sp.]MCP4857647.1 FecR domain-containing protein [Fuerstiella sp.]
MLHDRLQLEIAAGIADDSTELHRPAAEPSSVGTHRRTWLAVAALAACFLGIVGFAAWRQRDANTNNRVAIDPSDDVSFASIARVVDVQWSDNRRFVQGERLDAGRVSFASGVVRLQFDDGVEVTLEGPADYELIALGKTRLHTGLLSATVPPGAEGFRVDTPSARVIDLGTAFGIRLDDSGVAEVSVFDGLVDVVPHDSEETRRLKEG